MSSLLILQNRCSFLPFHTEWKAYKRVRDCMPSGEKAGSKRTKMSEGNVFALLSLSVRQIVDSVVVLVCASHQGELSCVGSIPRSYSTNAMQSLYESPRGSHTPRSEYYQENYQSRNIPPSHGKNLYNKQPVKNNSLRVCSCSRNMHFTSVQQI